MAEFDTISDADLQNLLQRLRNVGDDKDRLRLIKAAARNDQFTCAQARDVLNEAQFGQAGLEAGVLLAAKIVDLQDNSELLLEAYQWEEERTELRERLAGLVEIPDVGVAPETARVQQQAEKEAENTCTAPQYLAEKERKEAAQKANAAKLLQCAHSVDLDTAGFAEDGTAVTAPIKTIVEIAEEGVAPAPAPEPRESRTIAEATAPEVPASPAAAAPPAEPEPVPAPAPPAPPQRRRSLADAMEAAKNSTGNPAKKEDVLDDGEFAEIFGLDRAAFQALPKWKQQQKKKQLGLF